MPWSESSTATPGALAAIILATGPVSGAHLNPVVTLADRLLGGLSWRAAGAYWAAQVAGALAGTVVANLLFSRPAVEVSTKARSGGGLWLGEVVATLGLLLVIFGVVRSRRSAAVPFAVAGLHRRRLLVHVLHQLREPRGHARSHDLER